MKKIYIFLSSFALLILLFTGCQQQTSDSDDENRTDDINGFVISLSGDSGTLNTRSELRYPSSTAFTATGFSVAYAAKDVTKSWTITISSKKFPLYVYGMNVEPNAHFYLLKCDSLLYSMTIYDQDNNIIYVSDYSKSSTWQTKKIIIDNTISKIVYKFDIVNAHGEFLDRNPDKYSDVGFSDMFYFYSETGAQL